MEKQERNIDERRRERNRQSEVVVAGKKFKGRGVIRYERGYRSRVSPPPPRREGRFANDESPERKRDRSSRSPDRRRDRSRGNRDNGSPDRKRDRTDRRRERSPEHRRSPERKRSPFRENKRSKSPDR